MSTVKTLPPARVSLEFFPPKDISTQRALMTAAHALRRFQPEFQTVTLGANGSGTEGSEEWPDRLQRLTEVPTAAHLPLTRFTGKTGVLEHAEHLWQQGIRRLVVIRGDGGLPLDGFKSVAQAVGELKKLHPFTIAVSAYPESHPLASSPQADLDTLLEKQAAGADVALTQFFFDNADFYRFRDRAERAGFYRDIVPGVMPITRSQAVFSFAEKCGARVPDALRERFAACAGDNEAATKVARQTIQQQVANLAENGVDALHIYTMNRIDLAADTIRAFHKAHRALPGRKPERLSA